MRAHLTVSLIVLGLLSGCKPPVDSAYYNRGGPESLLDVSSEVVNLSVAGPNEVSALADWIHTDQPTRAELYCDGGDPRCIQAQQVLDLNGVPTMVVPSGDYNVALVYERVLARDCNPRFIDNHSNNRNLSHPAWGCSVAANMVQHVSDKQQFISPNLTDETPARSTLQAFDRAYIPRTTKPVYVINQSLTSAGRIQ